MDGVEKRERGDEEGDEHDGGGLEKKTGWKERLRGLGKMKTTDFVRSITR